MNQSQKKGAPQSKTGKNSFNKKRDNRSPKVEEESEFVETVVKIRRCAKVVKGGRRFSFSVLAVVGDQKGKVGIGLGKANEVPEAIRKAIQDAKKNFITVNLRGTTIPHEVLAKHKGGKVLLKPACEGTGVKAGGPVRAVIEAAGVTDVMTKSLGSGTPLAVVNATMEALKQLRSFEQIKKLRSVSKAA